MDRLVLDGPVRKIGMKNRSVSGFVSTRFGPIPFESQLEHDFLIRLDVMTSVVDVLAQPVRIDYRDQEGRKRRYVPDFYVEFNAGKSWLVEVKYRQDLRKDWPDLKPRFKSAVRFARQYKGRPKLRFRLVSEVEIRSGSWLSNASFLRGYRDRVPHLKHELGLVHMLRAMEEATPETLLAATFRDPKLQLEGIGCLWRLVARGAIEADMSRPLTMTTPIWMNRATERYCL